MQLAENAIRSAGRRYTQEIPDLGGRVASSKTDPKELGSMKLVIVGVGR